MTKSSNIQENIEQIRTLLQEIKAEEDPLAIQRKQLLLEQLMSILFLTASYHMRRSEQNEELSNRNFKEKALKVLLGDITAVGKTVCKVISGVIGIIGGGVLTLSPIAFFNNMAKDQLDAVSQGINLLSKGSDSVGGIVEGGNQADQTKSQYHFELTKKRGDDLSQQEKESGSRASRAEQQAAELEGSRHRATEAMLGG